MTAGMNMSCPLFRLALLVFVGGMSLGMGLSSKEKKDVRKCALGLDETATTCC
jgi:hypothetical protein